MAKHIHRTYHGEYMCLNDPSCDLERELYIERMIELEYRDGLARLARARNAEARPATT